LESDERREVIEMGIGGDASEVGLSHGALALKVARVFARLLSCLTLRAVANVSVVARAGV
jgi:hypothetical protein